jgi:hypothetical protein
MDKRKWHFAKMKSAHTCAARTCGRVADRWVQYATSRRRSVRIASCEPHATALFTLATAEVIRG